MKITRRDIVPLSLQRCFLFTIVVCQIFFILPRPVKSQSTSAGFQDYIVLGREQQVRNFLIDHVLENEGVDSIDGVHDVESVVTLTATLDNQRVYYDHWEDGFDDGIPGIPSQSTTIVLDLNRGEVRSLASDTPGDVDERNRPVPVDDRDPADIRYDGGDRIISLGGPVDVAHNMWPLDEPWIGGAWEMYARQALTGFHSYLIPVGTDSYDYADPGAGDPGHYRSFKYVELQIVAYVDGTRVVIANTANEEVVIDLAAGQSYYSRGFIDETTADSIAILENTTVTSSEDIQVGILTGGDGSAQTRFFNAIPLKAYGRDYVVPVQGPLDASSEVNIYVFNPNNTDATVDIIDSDNSQTVTLGPLSSTSWTEEMPGNASLASGSGARIISDKLIWGIVSYDYTSPNRDWGFSLIPARYLKDDYYISWSPSNEVRDAGRTGSPVWITPLYDNTTVYVDRDGDDVADDMDTDGEDVQGGPGFACDTEPGPYTLDVLEVLRIFDCTDGDNAGTHIWATGPIALAYGEDHDSSGTGTPYLDLGYTVLPLTQDFLEPVLSVVGIPSLTTVDATNPTDVTVTITVAAGNFPSIEHVNVQMTMDDDIEFLTATSSPAADDVSTAGQITTIQWNQDATLATNETLVITFDIRFDGSEANQLYTFNVEATGNYGNLDLNPTDDFEIVKTFVSLTKANAPTTSVTEGDAITYTLSVNVDAGNTAYDLLVVDPLHEGLDYVNGTATNNGGGTFSYDAVSRTLEWDYGDVVGSASWSETFDVQVQTLTEDTTFIDNAAIATANDSGGLPLFRIESVPVSNQVEYPSLDIVKETSATLVDQSDIVTFTLRIQNTSSVTAYDVLVLDDLSTLLNYQTGTMYLDTGSGPVLQTEADDGADDCDFDDAVAGNVHCLFASLDPSTEYVLTFDVEVDGGAPDGSFITNQATIESRSSTSRGSNSVELRIPDSSCTVDIDCNDDVACTDDTCNGGNCVYTPNDANCDDNDVCTGTATCDGVLGCLAGTPLSCADGVLCTDDSCDPVTGCFYVTNDLNCDDGVLCTDDTCHATNDCVYTPDDGNCADGFFCNGFDYCDAVTDCYSDGDPCALIGLACEEATDSCLECSVDGDCDDGVVCTDDVCLAGGCVHTANDGNCTDDGIFCNGAETCDLVADCMSAGDPCADLGLLCQEATSSCDSCLADGDCDDGVACTDDQCISGDCYAAENDGLCTDDGLFCNGTESCDALFGCVSSGDPCVASGLACDDVPDACVACLVDGDCDDGVACTTDSCSGGACIYQRWGFL
jgi:fimbrial isopeptide formation D2 family protein/uncharacterized repeat protein (TIGR01451 family)